MTNPNDPQSPQPRHFDDAELIAYHDSELSPSQRDEVGQHLEGCEACREELRQIENALQSVQEWRMAQVSAVAATDQWSVNQFRQRLAEHSRASGAEFVASQRPKRTGVRSSWEPATLLRHRRSLAAALIAAVLVITTTVSLLQTTASADTLLTRAVTHESAGYAAGLPVSRTVLQLEVIDENSGRSEAVASYVLLADKQAGEAYLVANKTEEAAGEWQSRGPNAMGDLSMRAFGLAGSFDPGLLRYMQMRNFFPDVSAAEFNKLVAGRGAKQSQLEKNDRAYGLNFPFADAHPSGIRTAVLWVNKKSFDPFQLSIFLGSPQHGKEYRFTRQAHKREIRGQEVAQKLTATLPPGPAGSGSSRLEAPTALPLKYSDSKATPGEVEAFRLLHSSNACLGEEVYVYPMSNGSILVEGLVESRSRRRELTDLFAHANGHIRTEIYTARDVGSQARLQPSPFRQTLTSPANQSSYIEHRESDLSNRQSTSQNELLALFQKGGMASEDAERAAAVFSSDLNQLGRRILLNAWALERLDEEFPPARTMGLPPAVLDSLSAIKNEHHQMVQDLAHQELSMLVRLGSNAKSNAGPGAASGTPASTAKTLELAREQERLVRALFVASQPVDDWAGELAALDAILKLLADAR